jgi:hypothetical protein
VDHRDLPNVTPKRVMTVLLAFPLAGLVGFGGSVLVRSFWSEAPANAAPSTLSPRPSGSDTDRHAPAPRGKQSRPTSTSVNRSPTA